MTTYVLVIYFIATLINLVAIYLIFFKFNDKKCITVENIISMLIILLIGPVANMVFFVVLVLSQDDFVLLKWK